MSDPDILEQIFDSDGSALLSRITDAARAEAQAAAQRLVAIGDLYRLRLTQHGNPEEWAADTCDAVAAEIAATLRTSVAMGHRNLRHAPAMHERLPRVGGVSSPAISTSGCSGRSWRSRCPAGPR
jgi:Domain of unknown function (DUF222)